MSHLFCCQHCGRPVLSVVTVESESEHDRILAQMADGTLSKPIEEVAEWSGRVLSKFKRFKPHRKVNGKWGHVSEPIRTLTDLCTLRESDMVYLPACGKSCREEIKSVMAHYGLHFQPE